MTSSASSAAPGQPDGDATPVLVQRSGGILRVELNRPRVMNALNHRMFGLLADALGAAATAQPDAPRAILLEGAGDRGFCGGGDVKEISAGDARTILADEYRVDAQVAASPVPVVAVLDGITMGGGIGLGGHAAIRVVTERSRLAMPEVRIGLVPDVGGHLLLARAQKRLGDLLAVTAGEMTAGDAIALGFADVFLPGERIPALRAALAALPTEAGPAADPAMDAAADPAAVDPRALVTALAGAVPPSVLLETFSWWEAVAEECLPVGTVFTDPVGAVQRLRVALAAHPHPGAADTLRTIQSMCPTSVAVTLAQLDRTRTLELDLAGVLHDDLRVLGRVAARPDFTEGVRAQLIDKDRSPQWQPASFDELKRSDIAALIDPALRAGEEPLDLEVA